jgi:uncharacterized protein
MNPITLLKKYFPDDHAFEIVSEHSRLVAGKALAIGRRLHTPVDLRFLEEAAMLHDIGICRIHAPRIGCFGKDPYLCHGIHGRAILETEQLPRHALVCERHIGVGITTDDIATQQLPLPARNMSPTCIEEEIISYADLFFSKRPETIEIEKSPDQVRKGLAIFGQEKVEKFDLWLKRFGDFCL